MATQKQIIANRANAARSTGPITPEGKRVASQNSTRHGMLAQTVVLEGESKSRFEDLFTSFIELIKPCSAAEAALVETMTIARWKQMRIWGMEKAGFQLEMSRESSAHGANATRGYLTFKKLADNSRVLDLQHRYETGYERQFCRAYAFLLKLRAKSDALADDSLPQSAQDLLQFSCATVTWVSGEDEDEQPAPDDQGQDNPPSEAPETEGLVPAKVVLLHGPNSSQPANVIAPSRKGGDSTQTLVREKPPRISA